MAVSIACDNCGTVINEDDIRYHLDTLVPGAGPNGTLMAYPQDLCSKSCVNQSDKDQPEPPAPAVIEPGSQVDLTPTDNA